MLNWIVWNRTDYLKIDLALNYLQVLIWQPTNQILDYEIQQRKTFSSIIHTDF